MEIVHYCGFNGFKQVPHCDGHTLNTLVQHQAAPRDNVRDVAICWNYMAMVDGEGGITKYGLVSGKNVCDRISPPPGDNSKIVQISATPRHILACTEDGECWTHEEAKGWRKIQVGAEGKVKGSIQSSCNNTKEDDESSDKTLIDINDTPSSQEVTNTDKKPHLVKTACGDSHNLALDSEGRAYSLPSPLDFDPFPSNSSHKVVDIACGKEHCVLLTEHGQVYTWGGGSRGQLGHGALVAEEKPKLVMALDGMKIRKIAAGGWHTAVISQFDDLYMFGWNESGQLAQTTNLVKPAECFAAVEKLLMACCTMQPEDTGNPRGDAEDCEVYHKNDGDSPGASGTEEIEKEAVNCYNAATSCNDTSADLVVVQNVPMLVQIPGHNDAKVVDVACGSRHTVVLTSTNQLYGFGWNKYGQLGLGHTVTKDSMERINLPKSVERSGSVKMLRCGDWGTALVTTAKKS